MIFVEKILYNNLKGCDFNEWKCLKTFNDGTYGF